ncbi:MAG: hypothetical protein H6724_13075 [Sandaracinus sp.]|nr:hypothetical protein [Sandaracinus sp.]
MTLRPLRLVLLAALAIAGCHETHVVEPEPEPTVPTDPVVVGETTSATLGVDGGVLSVAGLSLRVPAGALTEPTTIRVTATTERPPTGFSSYTPVLRFEPAGLRFATPATIEIPFAGDARLATIFWTDESDAFTALETTLDGAVATARVEHFSRAFVGTACEGESCCRQAVGKVDVLFVVDNSNSMAEEQAALSREIPRLVAALATGDADADGTQDFPAIASLRTGVVTSNMGTGNHIVPTCEAARFGDDGVLMSRGNTARSGCDATYPRIQSYEASVDAAETYAHDVSCVANLGTGGCGFEQQLEAALKALTPSTSTTTFVEGTVGHADGANAGFLRDDAVLLVVMLTDEDDCSAIEPEIFDPGSTTFGGDLNLRCFTYPEAVQPLDRFVEGLLAAKGDAARLVFAPITGFPQDLEGQSVDTILEDDRMVERVDPAMPSRLLPSCQQPDGQLAFPARRILGVAAGLADGGAAIAPGSICQGSFAAPISRILDRVSARVGGSCE